MCQRHKSDLNKRTTFFESFVTVMKMKDIRTKSENTTPRQRAAARIPKEALHQLWLQGKEKSHVEIENEANAQQNGDYTEPAHTGEKIAAKALPKWLYIKAVSWPRNAPSNGTPNKA